MKKGLIVSFLVSLLMAIPSTMSASFPAGIHSMYIGEVINVWKK